jgi:hypothetical protein
MYLKGYVDVDPSHATEIRRKPTKGFRRFAEIITSGLLSEKEEHETFTAVAILQEINVAMRSLNVTDVVRFTKDEEIIYSDEDGEDTDDMPTVFERLSAHQRHNPASVFKTLSLLLEHHLPDITLIIEVRIQRTHMVGSYPIQILVNGLATKFQTEDTSTLEDRLEETFADQSNYAEFESNLRQQFDAFMDSLTAAVRQKMNVTDIRHSTQLNILRPRNDENGKTTADSMSSFSGDTTSSHSDPVFQRYHSGSDAFAYCWLWSHMMHSHGTHVQDATIVDEQGQTLLNVGEEGFDAGESNILDPSTPFSETGISDFGDESSKASGYFGGDDVGSHDAGGSSWLDSFSFGGDSGGDSGSSCSSCGGGCGGGD